MQEKIRVVVDCDSFIQFVKCDRVRTHTHTNEHTISIKYALKIEEKKITQINKYNVEYMSPMSTGSANKFNNESHNNMKRKNAIFFLF